MTPHILTANGHYFNILEPELCDVHIGTIAHALSHVCRFNGHTKRFYSVAQHSVLVSNLVPKEHQMAALFHDAAEAFLGDVTAPLKQLLPDYQAIEKRVEAAIFTKLGLPIDIHPEVKKADMIMLATELRDLMPGGLDQNWENPAEPMDDKITPHGPQESCWLFLHRYHEVRKNG